MFITFEGPDTAGKSIQAKELYEKLTSLGFECVLIHFPNYETPIGSFIYQVLHSDMINKIDGIALQYLYIADQTNYAKDIQKYLNEGKIVILDRYDLSSVVYAMATIEPSFLNEQMIERMKVYDKIYSSQRFLIKPDVTFLLKLPVEEIYMRKKSLDGIEKNMNFMHNVTNIYNSLENYMIDNRKLAVVDATMSIENVHSEVFKTLEDMNFREYI